MQTKALRVQRRSGAMRPCPVCAEQICFTTLHVEPPTPFFYATSGTDVLLRASDERRVHELGDRLPPDHDLEQLWQQMVAGAPPSSSGAPFAMWTNFHCPHCGSEVPYGAGRRDPHLRIYDHVIVVVDGSAVIGDSPTESWIADVDCRRDHVTVPDAD